jgi:hypothetical protein
MSNVMTKSSGARNRARAGGVLAAVLTALMGCSTSGSSSMPPVVSCTTVASCPSPADPCDVPICLDGVCGSIAGPRGVPASIAAQTTGDCKILLCGENGQVSAQTDSSDVPDDGDPCTVDSCDGPNVVRQPIAGCVADPGGGATPVGPGFSDKVDLLFAVDNSASMSDKQAVLGQTIPQLVGRLINPLCRKDRGTGDIVGSSVAGDCSALASANPGQNVGAEFAAVRDLHVGIVTSSLGSRGGYAACKPKDPAQFPFQRHLDDGGQLVFRTRGPSSGADGAPDEKAAANGGFLVYYSKAGSPSLDAAPISDSSEFVSRFGKMITGVQEYGCGFEAQLESVYRFLFQPDPYSEFKVAVNPTNNAESISIEGVDAQILTQRKKFLRPDSIVAVVMITDENDSTVDPIGAESVGGVGFQWSYWFLDYGFSADPLQPAPLKNTRGYTPRGASACETNPMSPACTSCRANPSDIACGGSATARVPDGDSPNVRFFQPKRRFGFDPRFPLDRYVDAFRNARVPNRNTEHSATYQYRNDDAAKRCTNPVYAAALPDGASAALPGAIDGALCSLPVGRRSRDMVVFSLIGGVPWQLLADGTSAAAATPKPTLLASDWTRILGGDPERYDFSGVDPHMLESLAPRAGLPPPTTAGNGTDPIHGREYTTQNTDLQYACTFTLATAKPCGPSDLCDCNAADKNPPLCSGTTQVKAKAYPTIRELAVARALSTSGQSVVGSICPLTLSGSPGDPRYGYNPFASALITRLGRNIR